MTDEEEEKYRQESRELLAQSNDVDYANLLKKINEKAKRKLPLDTTIKYATGRCYGSRGIGLILSGIIETDNGIIIARFDRPMLTKKDGGNEVHASIDVCALGRKTLELRADQGEAVIMETTLGDKDTFCKIVNNIMDYLDNRGYLIQDPRKLLGVSHE
jgi:hypothetical protein